MNQIPVCLAGKLKFYEDFNILKCIRQALM